MPWSEDDFVFEQIVSQDRRYIHLVIPRSPGDTATSKKLYGKEARKQIVTTFLASASEACIFVGIPEMEEVLLRVAGMVTRIIDNRPKRAG